MNIQEDIKVYRWWVIELSIVKPEQRVFNLKFHRCPALGKYDAFSIGVGKTLFYLKFLRSNLQFNKNNKQGFSIHFNNLAHIEKTKRQVTSLEQEFASGFNKTIKDLSIEIKAIPETREEV